MSEEDMSSGSFEGSSEEEMNEEHFEGMEDNESENEGMEEDDEIGDEDEEEEEESNEDNQENEDDSDDEEREVKIAEDIKKRISNEKKELFLEGELSEEVFLYLLELLKQDSETLISSLSLRSKQHQLELLT